ncbi:MAG: carbamoyl phosphate synthase small subunit [Evtepia sp.]|uniref:carbamoyl phosphate synthase small subunit n=1 Tax=Evtepia sp. TaxID=2773933 RepID=UPI002A763FBF|nr:carbamoyl phosphate synthase small subunit [Evtepia sp.]MDY3015167.1 carbamoyl phosphate synthase small subunit [Evtepia sp.]
MKKAYLYLENGQVLEGQHFGADGTVMGELVFTTGMTGCVESLTDPSYYGQLVIYTFPQFGNYGICHEDMESPQCQMKGVVVREFCEDPSNFRCDESVDAFLKAQNVVGIAGVDTRMLTQMLRDNGVMNAVITTREDKPDMDALKAYRVTQSVENTSDTKVQVLKPEGDAPYSVALLDYGAKQSIANSLLARGCQVTVYPYNTPAETILSGGHHGIMLSNGPGDPADNPFCIQQIQALFGKLPMFGICLGHQMMALAAGATTKKLKFGHRGANQPVKDLETGEVSITSQNHGYAVDADSLAGTKGVLRFVNVNDGTCEGVDYPEYRAFSLQFHPEAHGGPLDCLTAFDRFTDMMKEGL